MGKRSGWLSSYLDLGQWVGPNHPRRAIRAVVSEILASEFSGPYASMGRRSISPEMLLRAFHSVRSERQMMMERLEFDLLFRWFVGFGVDDPVWDHLTFSKNRDRLLDGVSLPGRGRRC